MVNFVVLLERPKSPKRQFPWSHSNITNAIYQAEEGHWPDLAAKIASIYHLDDEESKALAIGFQDPAGNIVTISSEEELSFFVKQIFYVNKPTLRDGATIHFIVQDLRKYEGTGVRSLLIYYLLSTP